VYSKRILAGDVVRVPTLRELSHPSPGLRARLVRAIEMSVDVRAAQKELEDLCGMSLRAPSGMLECEAAHVVRVGDGGTDQIKNALPLCRTHHWAFDNDLWCIQPSDLAIAVRKPFRTHRIFSGLHGKRLRKPTGSQAVSLEKALGSANLESRWRLFCQV